MPVTSTWATASPPSGLMVHWAERTAVSEGACSMSSGSDQVFSCSTMPVMENSQVSNISWSSGTPSRSLLKRSSS